MGGGFELRTATPDDASEIERLTELSEDGGAVSYRVHTHARTASAPLTQSLGILAVGASDGQIVGSGRVTLGHCWYEGQHRPYALLGSLVVHPEHRRRGIAAALARRRIEHAELIAGPDVVVLADIQGGNAGSLAAARRWATAFTAPALTVPVQMRGRAPRSPRGVEICTASQDQIPETEATKAYNFARTWTPQTLRRWMQWSPVGTPVHHYRLAISPSGAILAGLALRQEGLLRTMEVLRMPPAIRLANSMLHVVPKEGLLRNLAVEHFWFIPGQREAASALWNDTRWSLRDRGSNLLVALDRRSPVLPVVGIRRWTPKTSIMTAVRADPPASPDRLLTPPE